MSYQCPLCHQSLHFSSQHWRCDGNHQFDQAKEGYVNLLPVQHKRSKQPGDSAEMMQARRAFLDGGYYQPLQEQVAEWLDLALAADAYWREDMALQLFFLGCVLAAGVFGGLSASRKILWVQALPAAIAILAVWGTR